MERLLVLALLIFPITAVAIPITYRFDMPAFDSFSLAGQTSVLDVTVDNGGASASNQSYLNTDIKAYSVQVGSMMLSLNNIDDFATYEGSANYITTDSMGNAVLDLSTNIASLTVMTNGFSHIQLGTLLLGGGGLKYPENPI